MSEREIDQLFKEKLSQAEITPPGEAWAKVQQNLKEEHSDRKFFWGIAAGVSIIFTIGILIGLNSGKEAPAVKLAQKATEIGDSRQPANQEIAEVVATKVDEESEDTSLKVVEKSTTQKTVSLSPTFVNSPKSNLEKVENVTTESTSESLAKEFSLKTLSTLPVALVEGSIETAPTLAMVETVEITKPEDSIVPENTRGLNFKKMLELAKEIKTDNSSWSALRTAKNELMALGRKGTEEIFD